MTAAIVMKRELYKKSKFWQSKWPEYCVILLYLAFYCVITAFHEPWFDEAQSWQIAKCESIGRLIFFIPHYEGNPPLWYLILAIPAKIGIPFEIGLKGVGLLICLCSVSLLELKSPFPRAVKLILPFTYFFFYQYGIIVRPYGLMILAFILVAMAFKERNARPWRFVLCLVLLCETSSFCVAVAGGIAACWLYEISRETMTFRKFFYDKRVYALLTLLSFALILAATILPAKDVSFTRLWERNSSIFKSFLVAAGTLLSETMIVTSPWFSNDQVAFVSANFTVESLISCIVLQLIICALICCYSSKTNLKYIIIPYLCFCMFGSAVFLGGHHLGIGFFVFFFWLWISCEDDNKFEIGKKAAIRLRLSKKDVTKIKKFSQVFCILSLLISLIWAISSSVMDIKYQYSYGRETYRFLKETGLINAKIAMFWDEGDSTANEIDYENMDTKSNGWPVPLCAYANRNIVYNFNSGLDNAA